MHVRTTTVTSRGKQYFYTQIVQSERNARGVPTHRVLASFSGLSEVMVENLKAALAGARDGKAVVVEDKCRQFVVGRPVVANLAYLDVAVLLAAWRRWGLSELLTSVLPAPAGQMSAAEVVAGLAVHRCVAPASKLAAVGWYPTTALPELQGYGPEKFNNSRIHRVLGQLEKAEVALQERLPSILQAGAGAFVSLFLDITDTWFEGRGPSLAHEARTKEGLLKRKIGIALMCDQRGLPVRWKTLEGRYFEGTVMEGMVKEVSGLGWVGNAPVVMDRAMGRAGSVEFLAGSGIRFVTAITLDEYGSYTQRIPYAMFQGLKLAETDGTLEQDMKRLRREAMAAGFEEVSATRYVLDLGIIEHRTMQGNKGARPSPPGYRIREAMALASRVEAGYGQGLGTAQVAKANKCGVVTVRIHRRLLRMAVPLRERALAGELDGATLNELLRVAATPEAEQTAVFETLRLRAAGRKPKRPTRSRRNQDLIIDAPPLRVRAVVTFNPEQYLAQRRGAREKLQEFEAFVDDLNRRMLSPSSRRTKESALAEVGSELRRRTLMTIYDVSISAVRNDARTCHRIEFVRKETAWQERRRYDGFLLLAAHEDLPATAAEIVRLYFAKDEVERDFKTIKSELELHPVVHRTDAKVRAHVTVCVLSLLLERTLELKLAGTPLEQTAPRTLEALRTCQLNLMHEEWGTAYSLTRTTDEQRALLAGLGLQRLDDDAAVREELTPR